MKNSSSNLSNISPSFDRFQGSAKSGIGVVIAGHGSRDARSNADFEALVADFRASHPELDVYHGYIELARPALTDSLSSVAGRNHRVIVVPLFLFGAGHLKNDIPAALASARAKYPEVIFTATRELGVHPGLVELVVQRAMSAIPQKDTAAQTAVIVVGRGASDPDANGNFCKLVRLVGEGQSFRWVQPSFIGLARPSFEEAMEFVSRSGPEQIVIVPYFLFAGQLLAKLKGQAAEFSTRVPEINIYLADCLGPDEKVLAVIQERVREALEGERPLPCDTCHYRAPISGVCQKSASLLSLL